MLDTLSAAFAGVCLAVVTTYGGVTAATQPPVVNPAEKPIISYGTN